MNVHHNICGVIIVVLVGVSLTWSCFGTTDNQEGRSRDYESYQIGAYINGVEYHESEYRIFGQTSEYYGFSFSRKDSLVMIRTYTGYRVWRPFKGNEHYDWEVVMVLDSTSYTPGDTYSFCGKICPSDVFAHLDFMKGDRDLFEPLPFIACSFIKTPVYENRDNPFIATEGEITIGGFDKGGFNADTIFFSLKAEDKDGTILDIKDGYCKKFYDPFGLYMH